MKLRKIFDGIALLREKYTELTKAKFFIVNSSLNHFSLASFVKLKWQRCLDILWYAVKIGLEHYGHAFYSTRKEYAVLRTGAKDGIVPQIVYSLGETVACKKCMKEFVECVDQWQVG